MGIAVDVQVEEFHLNRAHIMIQTYIELQTRVLVRTDASVIRIC